MGGKTKQSQRTKNNARPSSSGRSAELLSSVKLESGIVNVAGTQLPALFPSLVAPSVDPLLSPELQLCLKKLNKKDPITKAKALQELSELVTNSNVEDVVSALSCWTHFYKILTLDPDRKVREYTQACHGTIVGVCGRRLAPHLKQLMPAWLQAQYDEHAPAQAHAINSLTKTFPDAKLPEVLSFCKEPIMASLLEVLVEDGDAAQAKKSEQRALQCARARCGALHALQQTARRLPAAQHAWLRAQLHAALCSAAFWGLHAAPDAALRAAWFGAVGSIISRFKGEFGAEHGVRTLRVLLGDKESNPLAAAQLWECLLLFMHNVPDWHQYLEKKELLTKRILDVLESGGWGDARHLSNMLLPLLASLPLQLLTKEFHTNFFRAILSGLEKKSIVSSKSERQYWITTLDECLRYLSTQSHHYVTEVVTSVHRTWLENVLVHAEGQMRTHLIKYSAGKMANLVKYWLKQADEGNNDNYEQLIRNFWQNVGSTLTSQVDKLPLNRDDINNLMDAHILLLQKLKSSFDQETKKQHSIKFEVDGPCEEPPPPAPSPPPPSPPPAPPAVARRYLHNLHELAHAVCGHYLEFARTKQISDPVVSPLITLLLEFDSEDLFLAIARRFDCDSVFALYDNVLRSWLTGDAMRCKAVVDLVFMAMAHLAEPEQDAAFDTFEQFPPSAVEWAMSRALAHPHAAAPAARRWLRGAAAAGALDAACARLLRCGDGAARALLLAALGSEGAVGARAAHDALRRLGAGLRAAEGPLEARARVAARLAGPRAPRSGLLRALLELSACVPPGDARLSPDTWREVRDAWQDAAAALSPPERAAFLRDAADILHDRLDLGSDPARAAHVLSLCPGLLWRGAELQVPEGVLFARSMLQHPRVPAEPPRVRACAARHLLLTDNLICPFGEDPIIENISNNTLTELSKNDLITYVNTGLFRLMYLWTMFLHRADDESDRNWCQELLPDEYFEEEFVKCIHDYIVICSLYEGYAFWPHFKLIEQSKIKMGTLLNDIIRETNDEIKQKILDTISKLTVSKGYFWSYSKNYFEEQLKLFDRRAQNVKDTTQSGEPTAQGDKLSGQSEVQNCPNENIELNQVEEECPVLITKLQDIRTGPELMHTLQYLQANAKCSTDPFLILRTKYYVMLANVFIAHTREPNVVETLLQDVTEGPPPCNPDVIINTYYAHNHVMLYEKDVSCAPWAQVVGNAAVCSFLEAQVACRGWHSAPHHWDFTNITLCSLLTSVELSKFSWGTARVATLARAALRLLRAVARFERAVRAAPPACPACPAPPHVRALPAEWADIYAPDVHRNLFSIIVFVLEAAGETSLRSPHLAVLEGLLGAVPLLRWESLQAPLRAGVYSLERLVAVCTATLREPVPGPFKYLAYHVLRILLEPLVLEDAEQLAAWSRKATEDQDSEGCPLKLTLLYYDDALFHLQDIVETAVSHVRVCEEVCSMVPFTDAHALTLGWLLLGDIVGQQCMLARGDLTHQYIQIYREQKYTEPLLTTALRLLPRAVLAQAACGADSPFNSATDVYWTAFTAPPRCNVFEWGGSEEVSRAACRAVWWCVRGAGAGAARGWRGAVHHRHAQLLDNITCRYITPHVVREEFALLQKKSCDIEDAEVSINRSTYEISCVLTVDESAIELVVSLARQHPLVLPRLRADHSAAGNTNWILMYLGYQNGTILNALKMWTVSVNSKLERAPQCYICYCRLHHATGRLPAVHCHTCRNKFHNVCLRKWFLSSSKMTCPLCRANF